MIKTNEFFFWKLPYALYVGYVIAYIECSLV